MTFFRKIIFVLLSTLFISCSTQEEDTTQNLLTATYKVELNNCRDISIDENGNVYTTSTNSENTVSIIKIDASGKTNVLKILNGNALDYLYIEHDGLGNLYLSSFYNNTLYMLDASYQQTVFYTPTNTNINSVHYFTQCNNSLFVLDNTSKHAQILNNHQATNIAGNTNLGYQITDGLGLNASFISFSNPKRYNSIIYFIDNSRNIRAIDCSDSNYPVQTLLALPYDTDEIFDLAIDELEDIYYIQRNEGLKVLTNGNTRVLKKGEQKIKIATNNTVEIIHWETINGIYIKNDDLYCITNNYKTLYKIAKFKSQISATQ